MKLRLQKKGQPTLKKKKVEFDWTKIPQDERNSYAIYLLNDMKCDDVILGIEKHGVDFMYEEDGIRVYELFLQKCEQKVDKIVGSVPKEYLKQSMLRAYMFPQNTVKKILDALL